MHVKRRDRGIVLVVIYVDDLIITSDSDADIDEVKLLLKQNLKLRIWESCVTSWALKLLDPLVGYGCCIGSMG